MVASVAPLAVLALASGLLVQYPSALVLSTVEQMDSGATRPLVVPLSLSKGHHERLIPLALSLSKGTGRARSVPMSPSLLLAHPPPGRGRPPLPGVPGPARPRRRPGAGAGHGRPPGGRPGADRAAGRRPRPAARRLRPGPAAPRSTRSARSSSSPPRPRLPASPSTPRASWPAAPAPGRSSPFFLFTMALAQRRGAGRPPRHPPLLLGGDAGDAVRDDRARRRPGAYKTAVKAFFINGVTDLCLMVGIGLVWLHGRAP